MTIKQWFNIDPIENPHVDNQWGALHITVLLICIAACVATYFLRKQGRTLRVTVIRVLAGCLLAFEITRRVVGLIQMSLGGADMSLFALLKNDSFWYHILPRPWCAISVWLVIIAAIVNKRLTYNIASMNAIICVIIFFAYPSAGFNNELMQFENIYSISTHALLFIAGISMITMGLTEFKYTRTKWYNSGIWELLAVLLVFGYGLLQVFVLKIQTNADPLYFMPTGALGYYPENEVQAILGFSNTLYLVLYIAFLSFYFNLFFLIQLAVDKVRAKKAEVITETVTVTETETVTVTVTETE